MASFAFLFNGFNIFAASYFTAIDRPDLSLLVAALRGLVFLVPLIAVLPEIWGLDVIWLTTPIAEVTTAIVALVLIRRQNKQLKSMYLWTDSSCSHSYYAHHGFDLVDSFKSGDWATDTDEYLTFIYRKSI